MSIAVREPDLEHKLEELARVQPVPTNKSQLATAVLKRAVQFSSEELHRFLTSGATTAPAEPSTA